MRLQVLALLLQGRGFQRCHPFVDPARRFLHRITFTGATQHPIQRATHTARDARHRATGTQIDQIGQPGGQPQSAFDNPDTRIQCGLAPGAA